TPEAPRVQELMRKMVENGCRCCVMEVSSHSLVQRRVDGVEFDVGIFTNLTQDHLDYHGTMEEYYRAKRRLFEIIEGQAGKRGKILVNNDDRWGHRIVDEFHRRVKVWTYGFSVVSDYRVRDAKVDINGTTFTLCAKGREYLVRVPLIGQFNVYNTVAALAGANLVGVEMRAAVEAVTRVPQIPGRLERVPAKRAFQVFVDYAHTPDALKNVLETLRELKPRRILTVFGCGGDRDRTKRSMMAEIAERYSDWVILTSDNPRSEEPDAIMREAAHGFSKENHEMIVDRGEAIRRAVNLAGNGDVVLIAGKGHENYQEIRGVRYPFNDVEQASKAISEKPSVVE
ncbi:MAG: UDP-N-acetylmuramoyl-L-alanyl-D-glutamate--2,6-diaminopimelate ligase, partial [Chthoniobacterales bacterium]|nr:UDP-N-acetylmuramoyl-L-alanyl-D-glutamate--2,6-diaminopimelate ligase [Chthoniobacterales bacterium]